MSNRIRIYDKDILTHDFEYCLRESDGKKCWYDHVTGELYPESGKEDKGYDSVVYLDKGTQYIDVGYPPRRELKHGKWNAVPNKILIGGRVATQGTAWECSACNNSSKQYLPTMKYCPNCGADMKGEEDGEEKEIF
jgi:hypothetical protein